MLRFDRAEGLPPRYSRLVYNRIPKTGSSTMLEILDELSKKNKFSVVNDHNYYPNASTLQKIITNLPDRTVYVNHANVWTEAPPDVGFFNIIREPIDHDESAFYYSVDPQARTKQEAEHSLAKQKADTKCGCYKMEYDECIRFRNKPPGCSVTFAPARRRQFCNAPEEWKPPKYDNYHNGCNPLATLKTKYAFVGLTEQYARSVATLERLLPDWFDGASDVLTRVSSAKVTSNTNNMTGTVRARSLLVLA